jgi:GTP cyclohydrolase I
LSADIKHLVRDLLAAIGEDPEREGLLETPRRVEQSFTFLTSGYRTDIDALINGALFSVSYNEMVIVRDIDLYSLCEHHLLPFFGKCHVAYIPDGRVIGLSKIPRIVDAFARRLQVQERLTSQIAETIESKIAPLGVAVVIEATHLCMAMRGVEKQNSVTTTSAMRGVFHRDPRTRAEFLELIHYRGGPAAPIRRLGASATDEQEQP